MNKNIIRFCSVVLSIAMLVSLITVTSFAADNKTGEGAYGTPIIDGKIEDEWNKTNPIIMENCITYDDTEYIGWFKILWDENNLYVLSRISSALSASFLETTTLMPTPML